jgi:TolB protein
MMRSKYTLWLLVLMLSCSSSKNAQPLTSHLEIFDLELNQRTRIYAEKARFEAPNWSPNGNYLLLNSGGKLFTISPTGEQKRWLNTDFADKCNNDHLISPDGTHIAISHHDQPGVPYGEDDYMTSKIFLLPAGGGTPRLVTTNAPSFLHGWSPDGKHLTYTALRNGDFDIYECSVDGGPETRLTDNPGLDDGPEYGPEGKFIYYNSMAGGKMDIWRMNRDGTRRVQLTNDQYSNWFPHVSPTNEGFVFLSYLEDQGDRHPPMKRVALRYYDFTTEKIRELCRFTGGQGTINVPSWSPDGKRFAFVSYEGGEND